MLHALRGTVIDSSNASVINDIMECMRQVDPDSVVYNFERCRHSGFESTHQHPNFHEVIIPLVSELIASQHTIVFGDFSLWEW